MMFEAIVKDIVNLSQDRVDEIFWTDLIHDSISSFVFSSDSLFLVSIVLESLFDVFRFRKRARVSLSSASRKKVKSIDKKCICIMSIM